IARAVLYEGYMLYPYRPSAVKNRQRFNFGVIYPRIYSEAQCGDACMMQTECLVSGHEDEQVNIRVRFLRMVARTVAQSAAGAMESLSSNQRFELVERLDVAGRSYQPWQEATEEEIALPEFRLGNLAAKPFHHDFDLGASHDMEALYDESGRIAGAIY